MILFAYELKARFAGQSRRVFQNWRGCWHGCLSPTWMMSCRLSSLRSPNAPGESEFGRFTVNVCLEGSGTRYGTGLYGMKGGAEPGGLEMRFRTSARGMDCCRAWGTVVGRGGGETASMWTCKEKVWRCGAVQVYK